MTLVDIECTLSMDEISFKYILLNILLNSKEAFKASNKNTKIIKISSKNEKENFVLYISDNAGGIPEANMIKIFEFGYSTKLGSTGLGLPSVSALIAASDGEFKLRNFLNGIEVEIKLRKI